MKRIAFGCAMLLACMPALAQQILRGTVRDLANNTALAGATISITGKTPVITDKNGLFSVPCTNTDKLIVSYVGYETATINIKNCSEALHILLSPSPGYLNNVEISATSSNNKLLLYQPESITKLTPLELKRGHGVFFDDVIQTSVPGVIMSRRSVAGGQQLNIRGYGNGGRGTRGISSNFDAQGYKVYLNGIPVTDAEGITTMDDLDYVSLGNVELIKGPAGTLYGQAIAGVVNLKITPAEKGKTSVAQDIMIGNYGLQRFTTWLKTGGEKSSVLLNYGKQKSDGFSRHNRSHKDFLNFAGEFTPNEKQTINTYAGYTDSYDERFGELTQTQFYNRDYSGNIEYIKRNGHSHVSSFRAGIGHNYAFNKNLSNNTTVFGTGFRSDASSGGGWTDKSAINYGARTYFETRFGSAGTASLNGITGLEIQRQDAQVMGYNMKQNPLDTTTNGWSWGKPYWVINAMTSNTAFITTPFSIFTEWTLAFKSDLFFTAGISYNSQHITLDDRFNPATVTNPSHFDTSYNKMWSPHLAVNKVFNKNVSAYASYSTGYKAPVSSYFFIVTPVLTSPPTPATGRVNPVLKPEKGEQFEIGSKGALLKNRLAYQLALFSTKYSDKMTSIAVPLNNSVTAYSYVVNGGAQNHKGIELALKYAVVRNPDRLFTNITPFINASYSDFKYGDNFTFVTGSTVAGRDTFNYSGLNVFGVPKFMSAEGIDFTLNIGLYGSVSHLYKGGVNFAIEKTSNAPKTFTLRTAESYHLLNSKIGYRKSISSHFDIDAFFGVNNITGVQYPIMVFINQLPDAYVPAPPKAVYFGGLNLKYNF